MTRLSLDVNIHLPRRTMKGCRLYRLNRWEAEEAIFSSAEPLTWNHFHKMLFKELHLPPRVQCLTEKCSFIHVLVLLANKIKIEIQFRYKIYQRSENCSTCEGINTFRVCPNFQLPWLLLFDYYLIIGIHWHLYIIYKKWAHIVSDNQSCC